MSYGMSDARDYGPSLSKHDPPIVSEQGKPIHNESGRHCPIGYHSCEEIKALGLQIERLTSDNAHHNNRINEMHVKLGDANRLKDEAEIQRDHLIDGIREGLTILGRQPSTPELCAVAKAIQDGVNKMDAVKKRKGEVDA